MSNNPVSFVDPDGGQDGFSAWLFSAGRPGQMPVFFFLDGFQVEQYETYFRDYAFSYSGFSYSNSFDSWGYWETEYVFELGKSIVDEFGRVISGPEISIKAKTVWVPTIGYDEYRAVAHMLRTANRTFVSTPGGMQVLGQHNPAGLMDLVLTDRMFKLDPMGGVIPESVQSGSWTMTPVKYANVNVQTKSEITENSDAVGVAPGLRYTVNYLRANPTLQADGLWFDAATLFAGGGFIRKGAQQAGKKILAEGAGKLDEAVILAAENEALAAGAAKTSTNAFKSFTASNYRHNLQVLTGKSGVGMDAHHIFPQAQRFQQHFNRVGLNIHDPKNLTWWQSGAHRSASGAYNKAWDGFFRQYPNANLQQIQNFGNSLMKSYGF